MRNWMVGVVLMCSLAVNSQSLYFPPVAGNVWDTMDPGRLGWCVDRVDSLYQFLERRNTKAFIILKDGKIVLEQYFGTFTADSSWYWASAGKTLTAFLTGMAQEDGLLDIDDPVSDYLGKGWTAMPDSLESRITVRHQLTMTTGLNDNGVNLDCTDPACLTFLADPGTRWSYHNAPYTLLHAVLEAATGRTVNQYTFQELSLKTGIAGLWFSSGYNEVFGSKARSMARFGLLVLNKGQWGNTPILSDTTYFGAMVTPSQLLNQSYGYLWWLNGQPTFMLPLTQLVFNGPLLPQAPADLIAGLGKNDQKVHVVPSQQLVVVRLGNESGDPSPVPTTFDNQMWQYINALRCQPNSLDIAQSADISVFPNPADRWLQVTGSGMATVRIIDMMGRQVYQQEASLPVQLSLPGFPVGQYIVGVQQADLVRRFPLIIRSDR